MLNILLIPIAIFYLLDVGLLFIFGINFFYLTYLAWHNRSQHPAERHLEIWPAVTVQLPIYNEMYVAERLIRSAAHLDYPQELLEIQVLDDSTDETTLIVENLVRKLRSEGVNITHIHRTTRQGYKAGALAAGLVRSHGDFLAVFDADFMPEPDFLKRTLPFFTEGVAFVQTRWGHINRNFSYLTYLQGLAIDAHFMVEQFARSQGGYWFNFNGTAGVWRKAAIIDVGGWKADTLTEDLDLSYRVFMKGWRAVYLRDVEVPAELPVSFNAYRRQQHRWASGSLECALKYIPRIWQSSMPVSMKIEATLHLTGYGVHLLMCGMVVLYPFLLVLSTQYPDLLKLFGLAFVFNFTAIAPTTFFIFAQHELGTHWWRSLPKILFVSAFGAGMMVNTVRAALQVMNPRERVFERTPKFGILNRREDWSLRRYRLNLDKIIYFELTFALLNVFTIALAIQHNNWIIAGYAALFCCGLLFTSGSTIMQTVAQARAIHRQTALTRVNSREVTQR